MEEKPILFNAPMLRAIKRGEKSQTRRVCPQYPQQLNRFPYGRVHDRMWVRETWGVDAQWNRVAPSNVRAAAKGIPDIGYSADNNGKKPQGRSFELYKSIIDEQLKAKGKAS